MVKTEGLNGFKVYCTNIEWYIEMTTHCEGIFDVFVHQKNSKCIASVAVLPTKSYSCFLPDTF